MKYILLLSLLLLLSSCTVQESFQKELDEANYCVVDSDCINIGTKCPFGCDILVNKDEAVIMKKKLNALPDTRCVYDCLAITSVVCEENKCIGLE